MRSVIIILALGAAAGFGALRAEGGEAEKPYVVGGRVRDEAGKPVAGARVYWGPMFSNGGEKFVSAVADDAGHYRLEIADPLPSESLGAEAAGFAPRWMTRFAFQPRGLPTPIDITVRPGHWMEGVIQGKDQTPAAGIEVRAYECQPGSISADDEEDRAGWIRARSLRQRIFGPGATTRTNERGEYRLEDLPGTPVALEAISPDGEKALEGTFRVDRKLAAWIPAYGQPPPRGALGCGTGMERSIQGSVLDRGTGEPIKRFMVQTGPKASQVFEPPRNYLDFSVDTYEAGLLIVRAEGYLPSALRAAAEGEARGIEIRLDRAQPRFEGLVVDARTGTALVGATVGHAFWAEGGKATQWLATWTAIGRRLSVADDNTIETGPDGRFAFYESAKDRKLVQIRLAGYAPLAVPPDERAAPGPDGATRFELQPESKILGPRMFDGRSLPKGEVILLKIGMEEPRLWQSFEDSGNEAFAFGGLGAGAYEIRATSADHPELRLRCRVYLEAGETATFDLEKELDQNLVEGRTMSGDHPIPFASIRLIPPASEWKLLGYTIASNPEGKYRIKGLRPGRYRADVTGGSMDVGYVSFEGEIEIGRDMKFDFEMKPRNAAPPPAPVPAKPVS